jgi:ribosome recycling factor
MNGNKILAQTEKKMEAVINLVHEDFKGIKTGRAKPSLIEDVKVKAYDSMMKLKELASIGAPDPHMLVVKPWDQNLLENIEEAIATSDLKLNPVVETDKIRIKVPALTEETRKDLVKLTKQKLESGRRMLRQVRTEAKQAIEGLEGEAGVSEDDIHHWLDQLQEKRDKFRDSLEELGKQKEKQLMEV